MAPARMMRFVDQHVRNCPICAKDLLLPEEIEKVREIVYPESKIIAPAQTDDAEDEELNEPQDGEEFGGSEDEGNIDGEEDEGEEDEI